MGNKLFKTLLFSGLTALGLIATTGIGGRIIAQKQTKKTDAIAQEFLQSYANTTTNDSAQKLSVLASGLGIYGITGTEADTNPDPAAAETFRSVEKVLREYISTQGQKTQGPLDPIPEALQTYLEQNKSTLTTIQAHLSTSSLPIWDLDIEQLTDFSFSVPSFVGLTQLHNLLSLKAISDYQQNQPLEMSAAIEANLVLHKALSQRPELISYLVSLIVTNQGAGVIRHLEGLDPALSSQLLSTDQQQLGAERLGFEGWITYQSMQKLIQQPSDQSEEFGLEDFSTGLALVNVFPLHKTYLTLSSVNTANITDKAYRQLPEFTVCSAAIEDIEAQIDLKSPWWNLLGQISMPALTRQWQKGGQTMLAAELTHHITTAKAIAQEQGQWPETLPNLTSQTCPEEQWVYEVSPDGEMSLSFSHNLAWLVSKETDAINNTWQIPLSYQQSYKKSE
ncbi:MAG: hypothetical protein AAFQ63_08355 [Cyanobacteria bacterium J06621_11]